MNKLSEWVGRSQSVEDTVSQASVNRFCATIHNAHQQGEHAPNGYHWCRGLPDDPLSQLGADGHPQKGGFLPPVELPRRMWAASKVQFLAPIAIGEAISRHSSISSVTPKSGKSGDLMFVEVNHETKVQGKTVIVEQQTIVYREASKTAAPIAAIDGAEPAGFMQIEKIVPTPQLLFRYSALTFNSHRIHYDLPYTQSEEMYPELVVHAPLMATLLLQLAAKQGGVAEFSFRAVSAAYCNQPLFLAANYQAVDGEQQGDLSAIGADGRVCLKAHVRFK